MTEEAPVLAADIEDGAGCTEIWEQLGERRAGDADGDAAGPGD